MSSDCAISAVGIVYADALPVSERPSPAAPSAVTAATWVVCACFATCFTLGIVTSFRELSGKGQLDIASELVRLEMRPSASGSPSREAFFVSTVGRDWILQQCCPNLLRARRSMRRGHLWLGQRKLVRLSTQRANLCLFYQGFLGSASSRERHQVEHFSTLKTFSKPTPTTFKA